MPRAPSNQYVTHRIELGVWERKELEKQLVPKQIEAVARASGYVMAGAALGVAAYGLFWYFDSAYDIKDRISTWSAKNQEQYVKEQEEARERQKEAGGGIRGMLSESLAGPGIFWRMLTQ